MCLLIALAVLLLSPSARSMLISFPDISASIAENTKSLGNKILYLPHLWYETVSWEFNTAVNVTTSTWTSLKAVVQKFPHPEEMVRRILHPLDMMCEDLFKESLAARTPGVTQESTAFTLTAGGKCVKISSQWHYLKN